MHNIKYSPLICIRNLIPSNYLESIFYFAFRQIDNIYRIRHIQHAYLTFGQFKVYVIQEMRCLQISKMAHSLC